MCISCLLSYLSRQDTFTQIRFKIGPPPTTLALHWTSIGSTYRAKKIAVTADKHLSVVLLIQTWYKFSLDFPVVIKNETFINVWQKLGKLAKYILDSFIVYSSTGLLTTYLWETRRQAINNNVRYACDMHSPNTAPMFSQCRRRWTNIEKILGVCPIRSRSGHGVRGHASPYAPTIWGGIFKP